MRNSSPSLIAAKAGYGGAFNWLWNLARWPLAFVVILLLFALIYYLAPNVDQRGWKWVSAPGSEAGGRGATGRWRFEGETPNGKSAAAAASIQFQQG